MPVLKRRRGGNVRRGLRRNMPPMRTSTRTVGRAGLNRLAKECQAARNSAVIFDQSSFGKFLLQGKSALEKLQWLCAHDVDVPCGPNRIHPDAE